MPLSNFSIGSAIRSGIYSSKDTPASPCTSDTSHWSALPTTPYGSESQHQYARILSHLLLVVLLEMLHSLLQLLVCF